MAADGSAWNVIIRLLQGDSAETEALPSKFKQFMQCVSSLLAPSTLIPLYANFPDLSINQLGHQFS
ncbi:hypothetical protein, partial [Phormidium sp. CCY1219]|uniref:hypothetical protein n=1 Tax=Phormidium sp. CCY1219 TaxID=2886104 RepID=UPI002D1F4B9C